MDVCKHIVHLRHGVTLNSRQAASYLVRGWWKGKRGGRLLIPPRVFSHEIGVEPRKIVLSPAWCSKLRLNDRRKNLALSHDEFRGSRSDVTVDQVA
ncbi:hypothetical protein TNCV_5051561 [Trichonephila clavipes]|nr:hypothetical protein TNCV_5051561 [Trichonephila clavipes]